MSSFAQALIEAASICPYNEDISSRIKSNRDKLGGWLFFDLLLSELVSIDSISPALYPPQDKESTSLLIQKIEAAKNSNSLNQACLIYYLFLDYPQDIMQGDTLAGYFSREIDIPSGHLELIKGFWYMDRLDFDQGLIHLGHPSALPTFSNELIAVLFSGLATNISSVQSARKILAYVTAKVPTLQTAETIDSLFSSLCHSSSSLLPALNFVRSVSKESASDILAYLVHFALTNNQQHRLANLPLTANEQALMEPILTAIITDDQSLAAGAKDVLLMRYLHGIKNNQKAAELSTLTNVSDSKNFSNNYVSWDDISRGLRKSDAMVI